ncbi:MAG: TrmH family RNA methyltransferase [Clostridiales bacterium]|nr:TrmH family RNA methyltransferase [Clostridiales bacterium]
MAVKKYKKSDDISYALGATVTMELLNRRGTCARCVYVSPKSEVTAVVDKAKSLGIPVVESEKAFNILSPKENCYVIGEFSKFASQAKSDRHHVVLVNPSNSGNLGTIMRDVAAFDCADLIIIRPAVDNFDPKTVRASMGAVFGINVEVFDSFEQYIAKYADRVVMPFMLNGSPFGKTRFDADKKYSLVFGNEATGLPDDYAKYNPVRIEQSDKVDSLNLSVAVSVALYKLYVS